MYLDVIRNPGGNQSVNVISKATIVNESILLVPADTVAFFVLNGHISEPYVAGRYVLNTGVSPFFVRFRNLMTQGDPGISCQVWFVNTCCENYKSGGTGELVFQEQRFQLTMKARASYAIRYVISNPLVFISKLIGMHNNSFDNDDIQPAIDSMIQPYIKQSIISAISGHQVYSFQDDLVNIGNEIRGSLQNELLNYGINLKAVAITSINVPDDEFKRLTTLEEKYANGKLETDIELYNVKNIYGNTDNRTMTEMVTSSIRGRGTPIPRETSGVGGMLTSLPIQIAIANKFADQISGTMNNLMGDISSNNNVNRQNGTGRNPPPDLPVRMRLCQNCGRRIDSGDLFCRYCGSEN